MTTPAPIACPECGAVRVRTASGYCCPHGHGKIVQLTKKEVREWQDQTRKTRQLQDRAAQWATLPTATRTGEYARVRYDGRLRKWVAFTVEGRDGVWIIYGGKGSLDAKVDDLRGWTRYSVMRVEEFEKRYGDKYR